MAIVVARGFTDIEYAAIKKLLKEELDFKVNIRRWKRNYAPGAIDIRPTKAQDYKFTPEQVDKIFDLLMGLGNIVIHGKHLQYYYDNRYLLFMKGFNFVMQLVK